MRNTIRIGAVLFAALLLGAACGSKTSTPAASGGGTTATTSALDQALANMLPAKLKTAGKITVATDASYAPNEFFMADNTTIQGMDVDLGKAIGDVLGVQVVFQNAAFDTIIPSLGTRYDLGISSFTDSKVREQTVDMVTYYQAGTSFLVQKGKNQGLTALAALCGKKVGVEKGTVQLDDANAQSAKCTGGGMAAIDVQAFPDQGGANQALNSGRVDVVMLDTPVAAYQAKLSNGAFEVIGKSYGIAPYGVAVPKAADYKGLADAILGAMKKLDSTGTYIQILKKWGVESGAITNFQINGAIS